MYPPFQKNEAITLLLACGVLIFLIVNFKRFRETVPYFLLLALSFFALLLSEISTNAEAFIWPQQFNLLEHLGLALNTIFLTAWVWLLFYRPRSGS